MAHFVPTPGSISGKTAGENPASTKGAPAERQTKKETFSWKVSSDIIPEKRAQPLFSAYSYYRRDPMTIATVKDGKKLKIIPEGRIDALTAPELERKLSNELDDTAEELVFNLENVEYLSTAGLRVFLACSQEMEARGGSIRVVHVNEVIMRVLTLTGFQDFLNIE